MKTVTFSKVFTYFFFLIMGLIGIGLLVHTLDPANLFHPPTSLPRTGNQTRLRIASLINSNAYNAILVGNSYTGSFDARLLDTDGRITLLANPAGMSPAEGVFIVRHAIRDSNRLRYVFFGLTLSDFDRASSQVTRLKSYEFLFNRSTINLTKYGLSLGILYDESIEVLVNKVRKRLKAYRGQTDSLHKTIYSEKKVLQSYKAMLNYHRLKPVESLGQMKAHFEQTIIPLIKQNPHVQFTFFIPPNSILLYKIWQQTGRLDPLLAFKRYVYKALSQYHNVRLYDFQDDPSIIYRLDQFKDVGHFSPVIAHEMEVGMVMSNRKYLVGGDDKKRIEHFNSIIKLYHIPT